MPGWNQDSTGEYYNSEFNVRVTGLQSIDNKSYWFDENGYKQTGFIHDESTGTRYFFPDGDYAMGNTEIDGNMYHFSDEGFLYVGFVSDSNGIKFYDDYGNSCTGEIEYNGEKYYICEDGYFRVGLVTSQDGTVKGYSKYGYPLKGLSEISGKMYLFSDDSSLITDCFYHGYNISATGEATPVERLDISRYNLTTNNTFVKNSEVEEKIDDILNSIITVGMSEYQQLRAVYDWVMKNIKYVSIYADVSAGFDQKVADLALYALNYRRGACYHFSSLILYMMDRLGIQALIAPGQSTRVGGGWTLHYWNMVVYQGQWYHFDPLLEQAWSPYKSFLKADSAIYGYSSLWVKGTIPESAAKSAG